MIFYYEIGHPANDDLAFVPLYMFPDGLYVELVLMKQESPADNWISTVDAALCCRLELAYVTDEPITWGFFTISTGILA